MSPFSAAAAVSFDNLPIVLRIESIIVGHIASLTSQARREALNDREWTDGNGKGYRRTVHRGWRRFCDAPSWNGLALFTEIQQASGRVQIETERPR